MHSAWKILVHEPKRKAPQPWILILIHPCSLYRLHPLLLCTAWRIVTESSHFVT